MADLGRQRVREPSNADAHQTESSRFNHARQPIHDAVTSAFNTTDNSLNAISPEVLNQITSHLTSQITANVIQQLKATNLSGPTPVQPQYTNAAMATSPANSNSPTMDQRNVYTPPSPHRPSEEPVQNQPSPVLPSSKTVPANHGRVRTPPVVSESRPSPPPNQADQVDEQDAHTDRPKGPRRLSTGTDATILEKIWGTLFNENGEPTQKLGQFLRGIAVHLIEDHEPKQSLVITPEKMQKYYQMTKIPNEIYPWQDIFDDKTSSISRLFRDLEVQHHLIQDKLNERPEIPGLTPHGFERWVTLLLLAHPEEEFERLQKTALDMPISNPDDKKERFPKEISRRLFPDREDTKVIERLQKAIANHCNLTVTPKPKVAPESELKPPQTTHRSSIDTGNAPLSAPLSTTSTRQDMPFITPATSRHEQPPPPPPLFSSTKERERKPYHNAPSESSMSESIIDEDEMATPQPIERERKPYVAQPGGGKNYDELDKVSIASSTTYPPPPVPETRTKRSVSNASSTRPVDIPKPRPAPITVHQKMQGPLDGTPLSADTRNHRADSVYNKDGQRMTTNNRLRSPSASKDYGHRSEGDMPYGSYGNGPTYDSLEEQRRRREREFDRERERFGNDRYDAARMAAYDPRDREREPRPRYQSTLGGDPSRPPYLPDEDYSYRAPGGGYQTGRDAYAYPPSSYREQRLQ